MRKCTSVVLLSGMILGLLAAGIFASGCGSNAPVAPYIVEGYASSNFDGTAIGVSKEKMTGPGEGYVIAGARWREFGGPWYDHGTPPSLANSATGVKVRLAVVNVKATGQAPGGPVVAWIEVLSQ